MSIIYKVLAQLEQAGPECVSGESVAREQGISRTAVWKAVRALKGLGYTVEAVTNRGYRLIDGPETFYSEGIRMGLDCGYRGLDIIVKQSVGSTNDEAKLLAVNGAAHGTLIAAEAQDRGRGRFARRFHSPPGTGLYMSIVLRPGIPSADAPLITVAAAVAVCRAVKRTTSLSPAIKWVNDVYLDGKKICGILTESTFDAESGGITSAVVGIGINISGRIDDFPGELRQTAGSLYPDGNARVTRNALAAAILNETLDLCGNLFHAGPLPDAAAARRELMREYRERSMLTGRDVTYTRGAESGAGRVLGVDDDARLIIRINENGETVALNSGEVSILL